MVFSSLLFLCLFLPGVLLIYYALSLLPCRSLRAWLCNGWLLLASLLFYAWGEPKYLFLMAATALVDYGAGLLMQNLRKDTTSAAGTAAGILLAFTVALNLGSLCFFKYTAFLLGSFSSISGISIPFLKTIQAIALPIGISFYTFQTLSYVIDVYRGNIKAQKNFLDFFMYVTLFPQLIAGPIVRCTDIEGELRDRTLSVDGIAAGICRFCVGLAKKVLLANTVGALYETLTADMTAAGGFTTVMAWTASLAYFFQIYFDFSGYSDMAVGIGQMLGFHFPENFRYPYEASSVTDFWRRWHITLSSWFREYLYIPLGGNRRGKGRQIFNLLMVWGLTGLWHGAGWNFLLWGLYFFLLLMIEKLFLLRLFEKLPKRLSAVLGHLYALACIFFGWVLFAGSPGKILPALFGVGVAFSSSMSIYYLLTSALLFLICAVASTHYPAKLLRWLETRLAMRRRSQELPPTGDSIACADRIGAGGISAGKAILCGILLLFSVALLVGDSYNPFLYFRF